VISVAAVEDNLILVDGLRAWARELSDIRLTAITPTVAELLRPPQEPFDVVVLDADLRVEPDPAANARQLIDADYRVLVIDGTLELGSVARILAVGVHGYLTRDHDLTALAATLRAIALGGTAWSLGPTTAAKPDGHRRDRCSRELRARPTASSVPRADGRLAHSSRPWQRRCRGP
jgi:two-component system, NarL family, nitrate/nitrite response regulator NarL